MNRFTDEQPGESSRPYQDSCPSNEKIWAAVTGCETDRERRAIDAHRQNCPDCAVIWELAEGVLYSELSADELMADESEVSLSDPMFEEGFLPWRVPHNVTSLPSVNPIALLPQEEGSANTAHGHTCTKAHVETKASASAPIHASRFQAFKLCGSTAIIAMALYGVYGALGDAPQQHRMASLDGDYSVHSEIRPGGSNKTFTVLVKETHDAEGFNPEQQARIRKLRAQRDAWNSGEES